MRGEQCDDGNQTAGDGCSNSCIDECTPGSQTFNATGSIATLNLPAGCLHLTIEAYGAQGGTPVNSAVPTVGGMGARMRGDFTVTSGASLKILVGQRGASGDFNNLANYGAGGGGGSFVTLANNSPLLIAGGGGGGGDFGNGLPARSRRTATPSREQREAPEAMAASTASSKSAPAATTARAAAASPATARPRATEAAMRSSTEAPAASIPRATPTTV